MTGLSTPRVALMVGFSDGALESPPGISLVTTGPNDAEAALRTHAPCVVVIDTRQVPAKSLRSFVARLQAQPFPAPCVLIGDHAALDQAPVALADLVLPPSVAASDLASHIRRVADAWPRQLLREHRRVLAMLPRPAWLTDASGLLVGINAATEQLFGGEAASVLGRPWQTLLGGATADRYRWLFGTRRTGARAEVGVIDVEVGGKRRKIECTASGLWAGAPDRGGVFLGTVVLCTEVTAPQSIDPQMMQSTKLEAMGRLAGGIAHDFNNLLSVIMGSAQLVRHSLPDTHEAVEDLREIENAASRAAQMTKQLLVFSRKQEQETTTFDVAPMIRNTAGMLRRLLTEQTKVEFKVGPESLGIRANPVQVEQVIVNLAVNARDAMPKGGRIVISASAVELGDLTAPPPGVAPGPWVQISVEDEGEGMSPETLERIFEPFFTTKDKDKGTGLGLSVVYGIIKHHGGHIDVQSRLGSGTKFRVLFPHVDAPTKGPAPPRSVMLAGGERILLVEDDDMVRRFLTRTLEAHGYSVLPVADGVMALAVVASFPRLDLLVTDLGLPGMQGKQVAEKLRERFASLPVIYVSGHIDLGQTEELLPNLEVFLPKPINASRILSTIRMMLDRAAQGRST